MFWCFISVSPGVFILSIMVILLVVKVLRFTELHRNELVKLITLQN